MSENTFIKILNHPERDEIISKLTTGKSTRSVSDWLKEKYPSNKALQVSFTLLDQFRKEHLNIRGSLLEDIRAKTREHELAEISSTMKQVVKTNKTYSEKLEEFVDTQVDWKKRLNNFLNVVETRFSQLYDGSQLNSENFKYDRYMIEWMRTMLSIVNEIRKTEGAPDQIIQHNITVQTIDEQVAIIQQAIVRTLEELPLETASLVLDKLNKNMETLKAAKDPKILYDEKQIAKMEQMAAKILPEAIEIDEKPEGKNE